jgi:ribosomal protein S18 acetylase RimI-like enzyme
MPLVELRDRRTIAALLRRNPEAHAYERGDLDDVDWPYTRWLGWEAERELQQVALAYTQPAVPVLLAIAEPPAGAMEALLVTALAELPDLLEARHAIEHAHPHLKLALRRRDLADRLALPVELLGPADLDDLTALYDEAYPGTWFEPRQLATGRYVGIRRSGRLECVAGVHVYSPAWGVAALGNVATLPGSRGRGLARGACAALTRLLLDDGIDTIALNVRSDNGAAIRAYEQIGFEPVAEYVEAGLAAHAG